MFAVDDTIAATASAPSGGLRGIVRLSGPRTADVVFSVFTPADPSQTQTSTARRIAGTVAIPELSHPLDAALWYWPGSRSYTGQPAAEVHLVGSPPLISAVLSELYRAGARPAEPGEFTLRAFLSGRIDLTQAEAVLGVIDAESRDELEAALTQLAGGLSRRIRELREILLLHLADVEAGLDFAEEGITFGQRAELIQQLTTTRDLLNQILHDSHARANTPAHWRVVLAGLPNAGKSTLFNALVDQSVAITSAIPGTTRDFLQHNVAWEGLTLQLIDTAGVEGTDPTMENDRPITDEDSPDAFGSMQRRLQSLTTIETIVSPAAAAQQQQARAVAAADLVIWCTARDLAPAEQIADADECRRVTGRILRVQTKSDNDDGGDPRAELAVSAQRGVGIAELRTAIAQQLRGSGETRGEFLGSTLARCRTSLLGARDALTRAIDLASSTGADELIACELRQTLHELGVIAGEVYTDDLLDRIFSRFCIGK